MQIKLTTESGFVFIDSHVERIIRVTPDYLSLREHFPGYPESTHRIHMDQFTGRIVKLEFEYEED